MSTKTKPGPQRPEYEPTTPRARLGYLIEECGEATIEIGKVLAAAGKSLRWGYRSYNPEMPEERQETNAAWLRREIENLRRELGDLQVAADMVLADLAAHPQHPRHVDWDRPDMLERNE